MDFKDKSVIHSMQWQLQDETKTLFHLSCHDEQTLQNNLNIVFNNRGR